MIMTKIAKHNNFPAIETERLILRQMTLEDTDFVFQHFSDPAVSRYLMDEPPVTEYAQAQEIIQFFLEPEEKTYNRWLMVRKSDHRSIGTCGFHKWDKRYFRAEIGYDLSPSFWGQGYMMEALRAVISNGFEQMRLIGLTHWCMSRMIAQFNYCGDWASNKKVFFVIIFI